MVVQPVLLLTLPENESDKYLEGNSKIVIMMLPGAVGDYLTVTTQEELLGLTSRTPTVNSLGADVQELHLADTVGTELGFMLRICHFVLM